MVHVMQPNHRRTVNSSQGAIRVSLVEIETDIERWHLLPHLNCRGSTGQRVLANDHSPRRKKEFRWS
jgi:hypothetical protein